MLNDNLLGTMFKGIDTSDEERVLQCLKSTANQGQHCAMIPLDLPLFFQAKHISDIIHHVPF